MKIIVKRIVAFIATICIIVVGVKIITDITRLKMSYARDLSYRSYFECPDDYDVLFLGTSHVMHGVNPLVVWNESGITSYNWATPTCTIPMIYWKLNCILETQKPKMVVVDCFRASWSDKGYTNERMHMAFDAFPLSVAKFNAICDLMDDEDKFTKKDRLNMLFPLGAYHTRWDDLQKIDFRNEYLDVKGCEFEYQVAAPIEDISDTSEKLEINSDMIGVEYLRKIIEKCQENNIEILLTYLPYPTDNYGKMESNMINDIAEEYGVNYINFTDLDVVNYYTDYADSNSHMNCSGQIKVSKFLAQYIYDLYDIEDKRRNSLISQSWDYLYNNYINDSCYLIKEVDDLFSVLMLCYDMPVDFIIDIQNKEILNNQVFLYLLEQLGINRSFIGSDTDFIIRWNGEGAILNEFKNKKSEALTSIDNLNLSLNSGNTYKLYFNNHEICTLNNNEYDIKLYILKNGVIFDTILINYSIDNNAKVYITQLDRV